MPPRPPRVPDSACSYQPIVFSRYASGRFGLPGPAPQLLLNTCTSADSAPSHQAYSMLLCWLPRAEREIGLKPFSVAAGATPRPPRLLAPTAPAMPPTMVPGLSASGLVGVGLFEPLMKFLPATAAPLAARAG